MKKPPLPLDEMTLDELVNEHRTRVGSLRGYYQRAANPAPMRSKAENEELMRLMRELYGSKND